MNRRNFFATVVRGGFLTVGAVASAFGGLGWKAAKAKSEEGRRVQLGLVIWSELPIPTEAFRSKGDEPWNNAVIPEGAKSHRHSFLGGVPHSQSLES